MSRLPGLGVAQSLVALAFLAAVVVVGAASLGLVGNGPAGASPSPTAIADNPTPTYSPDPTTTPADAPPTPSPETTSTPIPSGDAFAYTNPDGISADRFAGDDYPFIAQAQTLPNYGILWVDPNQRDFHIGLTGDIAGAIEALKDGIPRGITVYFYLVQHTQDELCALLHRIIDDSDELATHGIFVSAGGCGNKEMTVHLSMSPVTLETMAFMRSRYDGPMDFEEGSDAALRAFDPPFVGEERLAAVRDGSEPQMLSCGRRPFLREGLEAPAGAESADGPAADALRVALDVYADMYPDLPTLTWQMVETDFYGATFLAKRSADWLEVMVFAGTDQWAPGTLNDCDPKPFVPGDVGNAGWWLDPDYPAPDPASSELHVLVMEMACTGSASPEGRIFPPVVDYTDATLRISISVRVLGGAHTCPGNPYFPLTVVLPEPLGNRDLIGADSRPH